MGEDGVVVTHDDHRWQNSRLAQRRPDAAPRLELHHCVNVSPVKVYLHTNSS